MAAAAQPACGSGRGTVSSWASGAGRLPGCCQAAIFGLTNSAAATAPTRITTAGSSSDSDIAAVNPACRNAGSSPPRVKSDDEAAPPGRFGRSATSRASMSAAMAALPITPPI